MNDRKTFVCPFCQATVPEGALACPNCGSDAQTGWSDDPFGYRSGEAERPVRSGKTGAGRTAYILIAGAVVLALLMSLIKVPNWPLLLMSVFLLAATVYLLGKARDAGGAGLYKKLLAKAGGDAALVERLVDFEKAKDPSKPRKRLLADALERWEKDSR